MRRLAAAVVDIGEEVVVSVDFSCGDEGEPRANGSVSAGVELECQRCLEPVDVTLNCQVRLAFLSSDWRLGPQDYDVYELDDDGSVVLSDLIEDELILSLPIMATHDDERCRPVSNALAAEDEAPAAKHPFAALAALKKSTRG